MEVIIMQETVLEILEEICEDSVVREDLDIDLFESDLMDSLGFAEMLVSIEDQLGIVIAPSEVDRSDINTPNKILALVASRS